MPIIVDPSFTPPAPPTTVTSPDGILTATLDAAHAGVLLRADFSALSPAPVKVRFERDSGRYRVRSGDAAWAPGGVAVAYDHEAPLGVASTWQAVPIFTDDTEGARSQAVALSVTAPADPSTAWLKPTAQPDLAMLVRVARTEENGRALDVTLDPVLGSAYPVGSWDVPGALGLDRRFRTDSKAEYDALVAALTAGPVLVQSSPESGVPQDMYALATGTLAAVRMQGAETGFGWQYRVWDVSLAQIDRPPTVDAPLRIPGNSCADLLATYTTCADLLAAVPTCGDLLTVA